MPSPPDDPFEEVRPSPKITFDENDPVVRDFTEGLAALHTSMFDLVEQNKAMIRAMGQPFAPNVSGATTPPSSVSPGQQQLFPPSGASQPPRLFDPSGVAPGSYTTPSPAAPPAPAQVAASTPGRARQALGSIYRGANRVIGAVGDTGPHQSALAEELQQETGRQGGGHGGGGSTPPGTPRPDDPAWLRMLRPQADQSITLPRYGEFTSQDVLNLGAHAMAKVAVPRADSDLGRVVGTAGGAMGAMASLTPYLHVLESKTGIDIGARAMQAQSENMGYARGGASMGIGPFGFTIPGSQYFGAAGRESIKEDWGSFKTGLGAGISVKEAKEFMTALRSEGYTSKNGLLDMTKVLTDIKKNKNTSGDVGSAGVMASVTDQMMRYGTNSIDGLTKSVKGMSDIAIKARMSVDEVYNALDQFANDQQQKGATYTQGFNTGKQWMDATGMTAGLLSKFQENGTVQGMFSAGTGLLPSQMGAAPLGSQMDSIYKSMDLLGGAFGHMGSKTIKSPYGNVQVTGAQQRDALVAQQMGTTPDVIAQMRKDQKRNKAGGWLETFTDTYGAQADIIKNNRDRGVGDTTAAAAALNAKQMPRLDKMMRDAGFSGKDIKSVDGAHTWDRSGMIHKLMEKKTNKEETVTIQLAPELRGKFGLTTSEHKKAANQARVPVNGYVKSADGQMNIPMSTPHGSNY